MERDMELNKRLIWVALVLAILFAVAVRVRLLDVPLERDEGEYAYIGRLMLEGALPYSEAYSMKMPGIHAIYAFIMALFGQTHRAIHLGLLFVNIITVILLFLLGERLFNPIVGGVSAAIFSMLSLNPYLHGTVANAEHFLLPFVICGILLLVRGLDTDKNHSIFLSGLLFGAAFLVKQHAIFFIVFAAISIGIKKITKHLSLFAAGASLPFGLTSLYFWRAGLFDKFWFWTFKYAYGYLRLQPFSLGLKLLWARMTSIIDSSMPIWIFAAIGAAVLFYDKRLRPRRLFMVLFLLSSFFSICPGFYFRQHYFILLLPAVSILSAAGINSIAGRKNPLIFLLALFTLFLPVYMERDFYFSMSPERVCRSLYGPNPFPESLEIGEYLRNCSSKDDLIGILGSEPQIFFYSGLRSASRHIYTYTVSENMDYALLMQQEMIREIGSVQPKYIIFVNVLTSWHVNKDAPRTLIDWWMEYKNLYRRRGLIDIISSDVTIYRWDDDSIGHKPQSNFWIEVYEKNAIPIH